MPQHKRAAVRFGDFGGAVAYRDGDVGAIPRALIRHKAS